MNNQTLSRGSFSRLALFENCPYHAKLKYLDKLKEFPRPLPPGMTETHNVRGTRIHALAERFAKGEILDSSFPLELNYFKHELITLRDLRRKNRRLVSTEQKWFFNDVWEPLPDSTTYKNEYWLVMIADLMAWMSDTEAVLIDIKTGKKFGNEVKHGSQIQLFQLGCFKRYPHLERLHTELWYVDHDEMTTMTFSREQGLRFLAGWNRRLLKMNAETTFAPKPSTYACKFCEYKNGSNRWVIGTGDCSYNPVDPKDDSEEVYEIKLSTLLKELENNAA